MKEKKRKRRRKKSSEEEYMDDQNYGVASEGRNTEHKFPPRKEIS